MLLKPKMNTIDAINTNIIRILIIIQMVLSCMIFICFVKKIEDQYFYGIILINFFLRIFNCIHIPLIIKPT